MKERLRNHHLGLGQIMTIVVLLTRFHFCFCFASLQPGGPISIYTSADMNRTNSNTVSMEIAKMHQQQLFDTTVHDLSKNQFFLIQQQSSNHPRQFFVLGDRIVTLNYSPHFRVEDLKQQLRDKMGVYAEEHWLVFGGKPLAEGFTLLEYGVQPDSTIHLFLRLESGAPGTLQFGGKHLMMDVDDISSGDSSDDSSDEEDSKNIIDPMETGEMLVQQLSGLPDKNTILQEHLPNSMELDSGSEEEQWENEEIDKLCDNNGQQRKDSSSVEEQSTVDIDGNSSPGLSNQIIVYLLFIFLQSLFLT